MMKRGLVVPVCPSSKGYCTRPHCCTHITYAIREAGIPERQGLDPDWDDVPVARLLRRVCGLVNHPHGKHPRAK